MKTKNIINVPANKKRIAEYLKITPASVYQWFCDESSTMRATKPTIDKALILQKVFKIPLDYWVNPNNYELHFSNKKRVTKRLQRQDSDNTKV